MDYTLSFKSIMAGTAIAVATSVAQAAPIIETFNFQDLVDSIVVGAPYGGGTFSGTLGDSTAFGPIDASLASPGEAGWQSFDWTKTGITLTAYSTSNTKGDADYAYLDYGNAGLGVCSYLNASNQCQPGSDDNVTIHGGTDPEVLNVDFNTDVELLSLSLIDANHNAFASVPNGIQVSIDGSAFMQLNTVGMLYGQQFAFKTTSNTDQFYIGALTAKVPEPATLALLGLGLAGIGLSRRRKAS